MRLAGSRMGDQSGPLDPVGVQWPKALSEGERPEENLCGTPGHPSGGKPDWLWEGYHCTFHKELFKDYGISCTDYWRLFEYQGGVCARCKRKPGAKRMVVDEDDTEGLEELEIRGLLHYGCNLKVDRATATYVKDPPGPKVGPFPVSVDRAKRRRQRLKNKKEAYQEKKARERGFIKVDPPPQNGSYAEKVAAARQAIERKPT